MQTLEKETLTDDSPFSVILSDLKKTGIYLSQNTAKVEGEVKMPASHLQEKVIIAVNEAFSHALKLSQCKTLSEAARIIENIQVHCSEVEKMAYVSHDPLAQKGYQLAKKITSVARGIFHDLKEKIEP